MCFCQGSHGQRKNQGKTFGRDQGKVRLFIFDQENLENLTLSGKSRNFVNSFNFVCIMYNSGITMGGGGGVGVLEF